MIVEKVAAVAGTLAMILIGWGMLIVQGAIFYAILDGVDWLFGGH